jgi:hypothetical protein
MPRPSISPADIPPAPRAQPPRKVYEPVFIEPYPSIREILTTARNLGPCTTEMVLRHLSRSITRRNEMFVAAALRDSGYTRVRMMIKGVRTYLFYPPATQV